MSNKKNAIMLADTRPALVGTVLLQLKNTNKGLFDEAIIYYTDPISENDKKLMCSIMPCRFVEYQPPLPEYLFEKPRFKRFSALMFCRYEMFSYLDEFDTITWIDTDILIQGDLKPLILAAEATGAAMIREDPVNKTAENPDRMRTCFTTDLAGYKMDEYLYPSGTIVFSKKINGYENYTKWCYQKTVEWADVLSLPDQGVINAAIQQFNMKVTPVPGKEYCCYPYMGRDCSEAKIIHAWGSNKFWNDWFVYLSFPEWRNYYEKWLSLGGTSLGFEISPQISVVIPSYKPNLKLMKQCLDSLRNQNRANWERFSNFEIIIVAEPFEKEALQELVDSYKDPRIRLHFNDERKGIAASLNVGMRLAKGKYIARVDDDDVCEASRLYLQAEYLDRNSVITLCTSDFEYFGDMNEWRLSFEGEMSKAWSIFTCPFDHPTIMFRKDFFVNNDLFYDEQRGYVEDWELWRRAFEKGMTVGCIHKVLFYHRWLNTGSAGQTSKTVDMMRELVQKNFAELGVQILKEDLPLIGPWNGRLEKETDLDKLAQYFEQALEQNKICKQYDQNALQEVFRLRLEEAKTGILPGLSRKNQKQEKTTGMAEDLPLDYEPPHHPSALRKFAKKLLKPFYRPFRHRYEDRLIEVMRTTYTISDQLNRLQAYVEVQDQRIVELTAQLEDQIHINETLLNRRICDESEYTRQMVNQKILNESENIRQTLVQKVVEESENTRQMLSANMYQESENTRQMLSTNMYQESENTRQMLSANMYQESENTRQMLSRKVFEESENIQQILRDQVKDFSSFYLGMLQAWMLSKKKAFLIGTPEHSNIGDAAITIGESAFINKYYPEHMVVQLSTYDFEDWYPVISNFIGVNDIIFLQGGGNLGNHFINEENVRRKVIEDFPNNHIVIMPQTIYFDDTDEGREQLNITKQIYNTHKNLTVLLRGKESLTMAQKYFSNAKCYESLDMALCVKTNYNLERCGILLCIRDLNDESGLKEDEYKRVVNTVFSIDPNAMKTKNINQDDVDANIYFLMRHEVVNNELKKFASHKVVVTDRLHGLIFSIITKTPCVLISAYNQKIREFYEYFKDSNAIFFIDKNIDQLRDAIDRAAHVNCPKYPVLNDEYFDNVYRLIEGSTGI